MHLRRLSTVAAAAVPLLSAGLVVGVHSAADGSWEQMAAFAQRAERAWAARSFTRQPLWGEATEGPAFAAYGEALAAADALLRTDAGLLRDLCAHAAAVPAAAAEEFARRWEGPLAALRTGAHRRDARPPVTWSRGFAHEPPRLLPARALVDAAAIEVRRLAARGEARAAVELALDAATYGADLLQAPVVVDQLIGAALLAAGTGGTWRDEDLARLDPAALTLLAGGLARLDERCPPTLSCEGEALLLANTLLHPPPRGGLLDDASLPLRSWRYLWSARWTAADAVLLEIAAQRRLDAAGDQRWPERQRRLGAAFGAAMQRNPLVGTGVPDWAAAEASLRSALTVVRLLRMAVACRMGAAIPALPDPLGAGLLEATRDAGTVTLRSVGQAGGRPLARVVTGS